LSRSFIGLADLRNTLDWAKQQMLQVVCTFPPDAKRSTWAQIGVEMASHIPLGIQFDRAGQFLTI
jgi:hypothetical protein